MGKNVHFFSSKSEVTLSKLMHKMNILARDRVKKAERNKCSAAK